MYRFFRNFQNRNRFSIYFKEHKEEILDTNLSVLRQTVVFIGLLFLLFILISFVFVPGYTPSLEYIWLVPLLGVYGALSLLIPSKQIFSGLGKVVCIGFYICLMLALIRIDVYSSSEKNALYFPIVVAVLPVVFIFHFRTYVILTSFMEIIYLFLSYGHKVPEIWKADAIHTLVGSYFAIVVAWIVLRIRTKEGYAKMNLKKLSSIDYLTGLLNKSSCEKEIEAYLRTKPIDTTSALFILDLDDFKKVNDLSGHQSGDALLAAVGNVLTHCFRTTDIVGRIGGDEFMILLRNIKDTRLLEKKSMNILKEIENIPISGGMKMGCSIGVAVIGREKLSFEKLYQMADDALYEAKNFGKHRYVLYNAKEINLAQDRRLILIVDDSEMDRAVLSALFEDDYEILEARDGNEALNLISQYHDQIAVVLLDVVMPGLDGYQVLHYLKSRISFEKIPVIAISADKGNEEKTLQLGADDMIVKPIDPVITRLRVNRLLLEDET